MMNGTTSPLLLLLFVGHLVLLSSAAVSTSSASSSASSFSNGTTSSSSSNATATTTTTTGGGNSINDKDAMNALKKAISTNNLPHWDVTDFCSWQGVTCDDNRRVKSINLSSQDLTGALPSEALNSLQYLDSLFLQNNNFYGALPSLTNLSHLMEIDLSSNSFTSVSPGTFSKLTSLTSLSISNNPDLSPWNFPAGLADSTNLVTLLASNANINGPIPEFLGSFRSLHTLNLSHNTFTGTVPKALNSLPSLVNIDISNNKLNGSHVGRVLKVVLIPSIACFVASLIILYFVISKYWMKRWWGKKQNIRAKQDIDLEKNNNDDCKQFLSGCLKKFTYQELVTATNNFDMELGKGGSSNVFRGVLSNGDIVAVKRLNNSDAKFFESEVNTLGNARHCNVVRMVGYCVEGEHKLIVYEYMVNGSLDKCIVDKSLTWDLKNNIIKQIAKGLQYLHLECLDNGKILHRDVKPHNVLLDENFNAKLSDFGLAQILSSDKTRATGGGGTLGYLAPEVYCQTAGRGQRSLKADVYSYGVVVLEIFFGKKISQQETDSTPLIELVKTKFNEDKSLCDLIDSMGTGENMLEMEKAEMKKIVMLALWCLNDNRADRPSMTEVVNVLEGFASVPEDKIGYTRTPSLSNDSTQHQPIVVIGSTHSDYQQSSSVLSGPR